MLIDKSLPILHIMRFRTSPLMYMGTCDERTDVVSDEYNQLLRRGLFQNLEFQRAYDITKVEMGLLNPDPNDIVVHQFISTSGLNGYGTGHWLLRDYVAQNTGLNNVTNIGNWLADEGYVDITPADQDARKFIRVTDIGKYYVAKNHFQTRRYPLYILASENSQIVSSGLVETHRDPQPTDIGYDRVMFKTEAGVYDILGYSYKESDLTEEDYHIVHDKPFSAGGMLYSCIDQFGQATNLPPWYILDQVRAADKLFWTADWHFV